MTRIPTRHRNPIRIDCMNLDTGEHEASGVYQDRTPEEAIERAITEIKAGTLQWRQVSKGELVLWAVEMPSRLKVGERFIVNRPACI